MMGSSLVSMIALSQAQMITLKMAPSWFQMMVLSLVSSMASRWAEMRATSGYDEGQDDGIKLDISNVMELDLDNGMELGISNGMELGSYDGMEL
eukprot:7009939-Ditylum_brightwellii.AAC.1